MLLLSEGRQNVIFCIKQKPWIDALNAANYQSCNNIYWNGSVFSFLKLSDWIVIYNSKLNI